MWIIELVLLVYFVYVVGYTALFSLAAFFYKNPYTKNTARPKFCVLIPGYKEDSVIIDTSKAALKQRYPTELYDVVVIADSFKKETLKILQTLPIKVIEVSFDSSTKVKALTSALNTLPDHTYEYTVILDADNIMEENFLQNMANVLLMGHTAIQGQRKPKNTDTTLAFLDGVSEAINNHIYRQGSTALGLSASINGSGVAFDYKIFKDKITNMNSIGGFDRELELLLLKEGIKVHYHKTAIVYDEKVSHAQTFQNQRRRWISSQYHYLAKYFNEGIHSLLKGNITFFNSSILRNIQLPRLINLGLLTIFVLLFFFFRPHLHFSYVVWPSLLAINLVSIVMAIPREFYSRKLVIAILEVPGIFIKMFLILFRLKGANKKFIHTQHTYNHNQKPIN